MERKGPKLRIGCLPVEQIRGIDRHLELGGGIGSLL